MVTELQSLGKKVRETTVIALQISQKSKASPWRQDKGHSIWKRDSEKTKSLLYEFIRSSSQQKLSSFLKKIATLSYSGTANYLNFKKAIRKTYLAWSIKITDSSNELHL